MKARIPTEARSTVPMFETVGPMFSKMIIELNPDTANFWE
jgi:hypothetical protein